MGKVAVSIQGDSLVLLARGATLLRLKAFLRSCVPDGEISPMEGGLRLPSLYANVLTDLRDTDLSVSQDAQAAVEGRTLLIAKHLAALAGIRDILESSRSTTGLPHFDELLDPHQGVAANCIALQGLQGLCIFDEQGTGKTLSAIAGYCLLRSRGEVSRLIIVAPLSVFGSWRDELSEHAEVHGEIVELSAGGDADPLLYGTNEVAVTTFQSASHFEKQLTSFARAHPTFLIVDESYTIKNPDAQASETICRIRTACARGVVLCGTHAPNRPVDVINQFDVADGGICFQGFALPDEEDQRDDAIRAVVDSRGAYIRRTKEQVLPDLPDKVYSLVEVPLTGQQHRLYEDARRELLLHLRSLDNLSFKRNLTTYFQRRAALLQICVSPRLVDPTFADVPAKYARLDSLLSTLIDTQKKKVVLWSAYTKTLDDMMARYSRYLPVRVDGTVAGPSERSIAIARFQEDPQVRLFIGNPAAAGSGITLHAASDAVYLSFSGQAAHFMQSVDRIHRRGQTASSVHLHILLAKNTIEPSEFARIRAKQRRQEQLLAPSESAPVSLAGAISELVGAEDQ